MSTALTEAEAGMAAYRRLERLLPEEAERALRFIKARLDADQRGREAAQYPGIEPTDWIVAGQVEGPSYPSRDELISNEGDWGEVIEVIGRAAVRQDFAVVVAVDEGYEPRWFDDRAKAEAYCEAMLKDEPTPPTSCETCGDAGWVDNRAGGIATSGWVTCPDCGNPEHKETPG